MSSKADLKKERTKRKSALTRLGSKIRRYISEKDSEKLVECMDNIKKEYQEFEVVHDGYHGKLDNESELDTSDTYIIEVETAYSEALSEAQKWLTSTKIKKEMVSDEKPDKPSLLSPEVLSVINLPKLELFAYDGDPLQYYTFITAFDETVDSVATTGSAKLNRLVSYTTGVVKTSIQSCLIIGGDAGYNTARAILQDRFGNKLVIAQAIINSLRDGLPVKTAADLRKLADELTNCDIILTRLGSVQEVESQRFIASIVDRLQPFLKGKWKKMAMGMKLKKQRYPKFSELVEFMKFAADTASDPVYGDSGLLKFGHGSASNVSYDRQRSYSNSQSQSRPRSSEQSKLRGTTFVSTEGRTFQTCSFCQQPHRLYLCSNFKALKPDQKYKHILDMKLCENCLLDNHSVDHCLRPSMCGIHGCLQKHSRFIHWCKIQGESTGIDMKPRSTSGFTQSSSQVCVPIVKVRVNNKVDSAVMLDTCSTTTFCTRRLAQELKLTGVPITYELSTLTSTSKHQETSLIPTMYVESRSEGRSFSLRNVFIIDNIPASRSRVDVEKYEHLAGIEVMSSECRVDLLIGQDNAEALIPLEVRRGRIDEPFAVRTALGWSLHGNASCHTDVCGLVKTGKISHRVVSNFIQSDSIELDRLEEKVDRLWRLDHEGFGGDVQAMSCEDNQVLKLWDENVKFVDGHYELPIPWKEEVQVPDNLESAQSRLKSLRQSIGKRGILDKYEAEIQKLLDKSYAEPMVDTESGFQNSSSKTWYLPHHAVISDKKPGKLRVVFDCAARYQGESLNDKCKQGPDLNNKLVHVLLRFRQHELAIMADVEAMYYQVRVSEKDRDALRFLWVDGDGKEVVYRMNAHIFGGIWCACIATYALRRTLQDQQVEDEFVKDVINRSFYVDDCLRSVSSQEEAKKVVVDVKKVLEKGGFNLTKFVTNDREILEEISEVDRAKEVKEFDKEVVSKALGVSWDVKEDVFKVSINIKKREVTRKVMLSTIGSYIEKLEKLENDPLGLVSPCIITGRMLFQDATRLKTGWDEEVPGYIAEKWVQWVHSLNELNEVCFQRCLSPREATTYEVHNFSDASQKGFGCCSYLKSTSPNGKVHVALIMSKGRVSPMKHVTIPRLELQAAVMSAQMNEVVCRELDLPVSQSYFWVDSQIVLAYIKNKKKRLKTYVANRVSMIHSLSEVEQWKFIPGKENPADRISRGVEAKELKNREWREGPVFLTTGEKSEKKQYEIPAEDEEVKQEVVVNAVLEEEGHPIDKMIKYFSDWFKVKRAIAWVIKLKERLLKKIKGRRKERIMVKDLREAEKLVIKHVQEEKYGQEIRSLRERSSVPKSSSIRSLLPMLDEDGILCVGGRLKNAKNQEVCKFPCILPYDQPVTKLIVREYHQKAHQGTEWTLSLLRQKFWITRSRGVIKQVRKECVTCKKLYDQPKNQQMADIPEERLEMVKPFAHVGIDCFGPFYIKQGRHEVKRYGCIYTCMNMRAVHIEKLNSLETDSFINGFRRFMARRGTPVKVWSDNGTNFVGGSPEILKCMKKLDEEKIRRFSLEKEVEWKFNPPHASNMGGIWERQIRTIRKILSSLLNKHADKLTDEVLETLFCEVENMINSRPLTKLSEDVTDMSTLSPNQLLILNDELTDFPGNFNENDVYKQRWKFIQYLSNQFWKRWLREYIPELQRRSKWCSKQENIKVGDVVLLKEENTPRFLWPLGLIIQVKEGRDKLVRTVKVKTRSTVLIRPVSKVVKLEG